MNPATTRSMMRWMPINVPQNSTHLMSTLKLVSSYYVADKVMACLFRRALLFLRTSIPKRTKRLERSVPQGLNGEILHPNLLLLDRLLGHPLMAGEAALLRSILLLSRLIRMINENKIAGQSHPHHADQAQDKSNR